ncbi:MAG TPA: vitamin K epoxide reductase family protein [Candidatus Dojkabacteria bacterium]|nr:vitamin K epoxide reductase family protein [Candidatus Dojkabacteria bacterium]
MNDKAKKYVKALMLFFVAGALICLYLYYTKVVNAPVVCINNGCDEVLSSPYAYMFGFSVAGWGLLYYLGMAGLTVVLLNNFNKTLFNLLGIGLLWGVIYTIYLRYIEFFKIGSICIWCWSSVVIILISVIVFVLFYKEINGNKEQ